MPVHLNQDPVPSDNAATPRLKEAGGGVGAGKPFWGRTLHFCFRGACLLTALAVLVIGGAAARVAFGSLDLGFLTSAIENAIAEAAGPGHRAALGSIDLAWDEGNLRFAVHDLKVARADGAVVGFAPKAFIGFDFASLMHGRLEAVSLKAYKPSISLIVGRDGALSLGDGAAPRADGIRTPVLALLDPELIGRVFGTKTLVSGGGSLATLDLVDLSVTLTDERSGATRRFEQFSAGFQRTELGAFTSTLSSQGTRGPWKASITVDHPNDIGRPFVLKAETISVRDIVGEQGGPIGGVILDLAMSGILASEEDKTQIEGVLRISGDGAVEGPGWQANIRPGNLAFSIGNGHQDIAIKPSRIGIGGLGGMLSGRIVLSPQGQVAEQAGLDLKLDAVTVDQQGGSVAEITTATLKGNFVLADRRLDISEARVFGDLPVAEAVGSMVFVDKSPGMKLTIDARNLSEPSLRRIWPRFIATDAYDWFMANVSAGELTSSRLKLDIPPGVLDGTPLKRDYVEGEWRAKGAAVLLEPKLPPITGANVVVNVTGVSVHAEGHDGRLETSAGALTLPSVVFSADEMDHVTSPSRLDLTMLGSAGALLDLADRRGLAIGKSANVDVKLISGEGLAQIALTGPLYVGKPGAEKVPTSFAVDAEFRNVGGKGLVDGRDIDHGSFKARSDGRGLSVEGNALVAGVPFKLAASQDHPKAKLILRADAELDDAARAKLGFDLGTLVSGPVLLKYVREVLGGDQSRRVDLDLAQARLALAEASFEKAKGVPASLSMSLRGQGAPSSLEDVNFQGKGFSVKGRVKLDAKGQPSLFELSEVKLRPDDQFAARYEVRDDGRDLKISGHSLDARPFIQRWMSEDDSAQATKKRLQLALNLEQVVGYNNAKLSDVRFDYASDGQRVRDFVLNARLLGSARITGQILKDRGRPYLLVTATDGGSILQFLDVYRNMRGGKLTLTQTLVDPQGKSEDGVVLVENFKLVNEAALQRLFGAAPAADGDTNEVRRKLGSGDDVSLDRMRVVYTRTPGQTEISEGVLRNSAFGTTFNGNIDWRQKRVDLRGTFIPLFAINNLLARIPVLGAFLGGQNEGLIGVTFAIAGPIGSPTLRINPASAVAPGFLRGLFAIPDDATSLPRLKKRGPNSGARTSEDGLDSGER